MCGFVERLCDLNESRQIRTKFLYQIFLAARYLEMRRYAFGEHSLGRKQVSKWRKRLIAGRVSVQDDHSGRPITNKRICELTRECCVSSLEFIGLSAIPQ